MKRFFLPLIVLFFSTFFLVLTFKGGRGTPIAYQDRINTDVGTPFESTNSTSRYVLVESIVQRGNFFFTEEQAQQAAPDLVKYRDKYFSLFTPGVSFVAVPFYLLGQKFGLPQVFSFSSTILFSLLNVFLIAQWAYRNGLKRGAGWIAGFLFLFSTNAFAYSLTITQHTLSVTMLLLMLLLSQKEVTWKKNLLLGALYGLGILIDIPNAFLFFPILLKVLADHFEANIAQGAYTIRVKLRGIAFFFGFLPLAMVFILYNYAVTGSFTKIGQFIGRYDYPSEQVDPHNQTVSLEKTEPELPDSAPQYKSPISLPFKTRDQLEGAHILLFSDERAWWYYSPVVLVGCLGLYFMYRSVNRPQAVLFIAIILLNITLYAMFGDPWGGWSFGPRYLIPGAAVATLGLAYLLDLTSKKKYGWLLGLLILASGLYGIRVNTLGSLTTAAIPPKIEAANLSNPIPHDYEYNFQLLDLNRSSSLLYNVSFSELLSVREYFTFLWVSTGTVLTVLLYKYYFKK